MSVLRKNLILLSFVAASILFSGPPSFSESTFSEQTLTSDIIIEKMYQTGSGLPVGKIQSVRGQAIVFHRDPAVGFRIQTGLPLYAGDILRTRASAWIICRLIDGSHIFLAPKTTLTILQSSHNTNLKTSATFLNLERGGARFKLNPMPELSAYEYKVQTAAALIRTREADFVVRANPEATEIVALENSRLEVTGGSQPQDVIFLADFQKTIVSPAVISPQVETLSRENIETLLTGFNPAPPGTLAVAGTKDEGQDEFKDEGRGPKTEDMLIEEDIVED
jgi:hypothetical protein